jgi:hypothetical protein
MKITKLSKSMTYYVDTDKEDFPYYRTDENGENWENLMGESWEPCYSQEEKLKKLFWDYMMEEQIRIEMMIQQNCSQIPSWVYTIPKDEVEE